MGWTKISDGLPPMKSDDFEITSEDVLVLDIYGNRITAYLHQYLEFEEKPHWYTTGASNHDVTDTVTHWHPLPGYPEDYKP